MRSNKNVLTCSDFLGLISSVLLFMKKRKWSWRKCWLWSTEPADIWQNLDSLSSSWESHYTSRNPGILVTVELQDLVQRVAWVHIVMCSPSSCISLSNFRLNLWFLEFTEQVNLIIDGQSSREGQWHRKIGSLYSFPSSIVHTHLCHC